MFVGGSPGSTAGGIKTTTLAVLALTFRTGITGRSQITAHNRKIPPGTVYQAAAITFSGMLVLFATLLVLELTQQIPVRELAFEAVSALGTVGMSLGATGSLDFAGKIIIMAAMFIGRVGPMTLFMLLNEERPSPGVNYPEAHITLT
jgi:trk system potassium uptake protein TrkH